jgi:hypothetical protein
MSTTGNEHVNNELSENEQANEKLSENKQQDEKFMVMLLSTLDEELLNIRQRIASLDDSNHDYNNKCKLYMAWLQFLIVAKEIRDV